MPLKIVFLYFLPQRLRSSLITTWSITITKTVTLQHNFTSSDAVRDPVIVQMSPLLNPIFVIEQTYSRVISQQNEVRCPNPRRDNDCCNRDIDNYP